MEMRHFHLNELKSEKVSSKVFDPAGHATVSMLNDIAGLYFVLQFRSLRNISNLKLKFLLSLSVQKLLRYDLQKLKSELCLGKYP